PLPVTSRAPIPRRHGFRRPGRPARVGRRFVEARRRDPYYRAAQREGLRSRAAFKLAYVADRFPILAPGTRVLDLGAAPGGWSIVARERVGPRGAVVAVDPRAIEPIEGVERVHGRAGDPTLLARLGERPFDTVLSDMSPRISGAYATDHARSVELVEIALAVAARLLRPGGTFVAKVFDGDLLPELLQTMTPRFERVVRTKPPASREHSAELYVLGFGHRPPPPV
ncbi:MAG TPA: RlmE family RNA methyltransferase, partial [Thermoplasmata archaeon]|nr:RlmE family RNA methyltransferase [Thermoplasmata archaeon]